VRLDRIQLKAVKKSNKVNTGISVLNFGVFFWDLGFEIDGLMVCTPSLAPLLRPPNRQIAK
jgi:hypothetical protein